MKGKNGLLWRAKRRSFHRQSPSHSFIREKRVSRFRARHEKSFTRIQNYSLREIMKTRERREENNRRKKKIRAG